jgi:hypothetical protein
MEQRRRRKIGDPVWSARLLDDLFLRLFIASVILFQWAGVRSGFGKSGNLTGGTQLYLLEI